jgi:hypothetical protein
VSKCVADREGKPIAMLTLAELDEARRGCFAQGLAIQHVKQDVQPLLRVVDDFDLLRLQAVGSTQSSADELQLSRHRNVPE